MHPILSDRRIFLLYLAVWLIAGGLLAVLLNSTGTPLVTAVSLAVPMMLVLSFMCLAAYYLCRTFPLQRLNLVRLLIIHSIAALLTSSVWISLGKTWASLLTEIPFLPSIQDQYNGQVPLLFTIGIVLFLLSVAIHYAIIAFRESREAERRAMELRLLAQDAELRALRAQINPHFLFNSLNSISALTTNDPEGARSMTLHLADFLRKSLAVGMRPSISLAEELELISDFLAIEKVRYGPRLQFEQSADPDSLRCLIPPLLLQPLIENAIGHGIAHMVDGGTIQLKAEKRGPFLRIIVRNPFDHDQARKGHGIGMQNVRNRLMTLYQNDARCDTRTTESEFIVEITLPAIPVSETIAETAESA